MAPGTSGSHDYLSTACLHGDHNDCGIKQRERGEPGPPHCKYCDAVCICTICDHVHHVPDVPVRRPGSAP